MADEKQTGSEPFDEMRLANIYLASVAEEKIRAYQGVLPQFERNSLARNLAGIIGLAKDEPKKKFKKGDVVVKAGVRPGTSEAAAVNALNSYCLLPEHKNKRKAKARLHAHPLNYLKLALAAAELAGWPKHNAIMMLIEGSNTFGGQTKLGEAKFKVAEKVWKLLLHNLSLLIENPKYRLREFFRSVQELSAVYGYDWKKETMGWQQEEHGERSTSHWPTVPLTTVFRSYTPALLRFHGVDRDVDGEVIGAESVSLTLGWNLENRIIGYLEFTPCLVVRRLGQHPVSCDFGTFEKDIREGGFSGGFFRVVDGGVVEMPSGNDGNTWPYRLPSHARFEAITPALLAETFIDCEVMHTEAHKLNRKLDTSEVISPGSSPLAWMEAELLGRKSQYWADQTETGFLKELETEIENVVSSYQEWRNKASAKAIKDHHTKMLKLTAELDALRKLSVKKED